MKKELSLAPVQLPLGEIIDIANAFYASGMFKDVASAAQAIVKIQAGQEVGITPFMAMSGLHIIQGKITIGGGVIAAKTKASAKYDYKLLEKTDALCRIEFFEDGVSQGIEKFDAKDAARAGTQNMTKYPANMLFNRCISNGYKAFCPDLFMGPVYVPEDFGAEDTAAEVSDNDAKRPAQTATVMQMKTAPTAAAPPVAKKLLLFDSEEYNKAIAFMKTGGTIEGLRVRYDIGPQQADEMIARALQTTQEDIHQANAGYTAPAATKSAPVDDLDPADPF